MDSFSALVLTPWMTPHTVWSWHKVLHQTLTGKKVGGRIVSNTVNVLEEYDEVVRSPSIEVNLPAVVSLKKHLVRTMKQVKFSRRNIYERDKYCCQYCGAKKPAADLTYDHVIPRHQGGATTWTNIVSACGGPKGCNARKRNRTPEQAGMPLLSRPTKPNALPMTKLVALPREVPELWLPYLDGHVTLARSA
jgi:5-methylcytosine-specific restriction endonuclease McrA